MGGYLNLTGKILAASLAAWGIGKVVEAHSQPVQHIDGKEHMRALALTGNWEDYRRTMLGVFPDMTDVELVNVWESLKRGE